MSPCRSNACERGRGGGGSDGGREGGFRRGGLPNKDKYKTCQEGEESGKKGKEGRREGKEGGRIRTLTKCAKLLGPSLTIRPWMKASK